MSELHHIVARSERNGRHCFVNEIYVFCFKKSPRFAPLGPMKTIQVPRHYLNRWWPSSVTPIYVIRPLWFDLTNLLLQTTTPTNVYVIDYMVVTKHSGISILDCSFQDIPKNDFGLISASDYEGYTFKIPYSTTIWQPHHSLSHVISRVIVVPSSVTSVK